jgi:predicted DNA-binding ribbon-helix-helix protein
MYIEELIDEISRHSEIHLQVDEDKRCSLKLENAYTLTIEESADCKTLYLYTVLGKVDDQSKSVIFNTLMEANLFGLQTAGANFAFESQDKVIVLYQYFQTQKIDYHEFEELFWEFLNTTKIWTEKINNLLQPNNNTHKPSDNLQSISVLQKQHWLKP